jgi:hypothetical protein
MNVQNANICVDLLCGSPATFDCVLPNCDCPPPTTTSSTTTSTTVTTTTTIQVFDHYKCYKIKTKEKLTGVVDLEALQSQFGLEQGCKITKAREFCVPVSKTVRQLDTKGTLTPNPLFVGVDLTQDIICYQIKCAKPSILPQQVADQFGTRTFEFKTAFQLCAPAEKIVAP